MNHLEAQLTHQIIHQSRQTNLVDVMFVLIVTITMDESFSDQTYTIHFSCYLQVRKLWNFIHSENMPRNNYIHDYHHED